MIFLKIAKKAKIKKVEKSQNKIKNQKKTAKLNCPI
jgi:hypothetical protein